MYLFMYLFIWGHIYLAYPEVKTYSSKEQKRQIRSDEKCSLYGTYKTFVKINS